MTHRPTNPVQDDFFVGYSPSTPRPIARRVRFTTIATILLSALAAAATALAFRSPGDAIWHEQIAEFTGEIIESPYPLLRVADPTTRAIQPYLLVSVGKRGAAHHVRGLDGRIVRLSGTLLERDGRRMIELADPPAGASSASIQALSDQSPLPPPIISNSPTKASLSGELIDPKCFFGAMKPGDGKLHKACAIRCIHGGIPPMLASPNPDGSISYYLLATADRRPINTRVLPFVAEQVAITGTIEQTDGLSMLLIDDAPEALRRR